MTRNYLIMTKMTYDKTLMTFASIDNFKTGPLAVEIYIYFMVGFLRFTFSSVYLNFIVGNSAVF